MMDYSVLRKQLLNEISNNKNVRSTVVGLNKKIQNGNATFGDVTKLAKQLAKAVSKGLENNIPSENIVVFAEEIIAPIYRSAQKTIISAGGKVQEGMLERAYIEIAPANIAEDTSRIRHIVGRFREAESFDDVSFLLGDDVAENILRSAVTDVIKGNAEHLSKMGFTNYVTRTDGAGCCDWCASMCGTYDVYDIPDDFWRVHKGCSCSFEYKFRDTHERMTYSTDEKGNLSKQTTKI